ncbi:hypothetical protein [Corynebacterium sp.]|uniref:hypothetical protein n=1 Tax=Corynebacterium sp. TaxID=1720 RepID=UPI0026DBD9BA|nr:hypothetical protein [Corynebacterium sp.]MDO4610962.1 hypothetical protein [Corynebacterium sp.]
MDVLVLLPLFATLLFPYGSKEDIIDLDVGDASPAQVGEVQAPQSADPVDGTVGVDAELP